jgi:putative transposase
MKHRKRVRHFHEPGDVHELTFSCFGRKPLLHDDRHKQILCDGIDRACRDKKFRLVAFVIMPEHVHLLVLPTSEARIDEFLSHVKRPTSYRLKESLKRSHDDLLRELTTLERPGKLAFRFWQEGPGYDRNLQNEKAILQAIEYVHLNPVRRGLVTKACDWKWSSANWYESNRKAIDSDLPTIHGLPRENDSIS